MKRIDTHQHLWDLGQFPCSWCAGLPALNRNFLLADYLAAAQGAGIDPLHFAIVAIGTVGVGIFLPPIGIGLLLSAGIAATRMADVTRAFIPYLLVLIVAVLIIALVPAITLVLPHILMD